MYAASSRICTHSEEQERRIVKSVRAPSAPCPSPISSSSIPCPPLNIHLLHCPSDARQPSSGMSIHNTCDAQRTHTNTHTWSPLMMSLHFRKLGKSSRSSSSSYKKDIRNRTPPGRPPQSLIVETGAGRRTGQGMGQEDVVWRMLDGGMPVGCHTFKTVQEAVGQKGRKGEGVELGAWHRRPTKPRKPNVFVYRATFKSKTPKATTTP